MITFLDISLTNCCTYSCDYCISRASQATANNMERADKTMLPVYYTNGQTLKPIHLLNWITSNFTPEECFVQLSGGEPLLHDAFPFILRELLDFGYSITVNTNGNQIRTLDAVMALKDLPAAWRVSWHVPYRSLNKLLEDIEPLDKEKVLINYIMHPRRIQDKSYLTDISELEACAYRYEATPFCGEWNDDKYDEESRIYEGKAKAESTLGDRFSYLQIMANGDICKCFKTVMGNIYTGEFRGRHDRNPRNCGYCAYPSALKTMKRYNNVINGK